MNRTFILVLDHFKKNLINFYFKHMHIKIDSNLINAYLSFFTLKLLWLTAFYCCWLE